MLSSGSEATDAAVLEVAARAALSTVEPATMALSPVATAPYAGRP